MDTLQCAIVLGKLDRFDWEIAQRKRLGAHYRERLTQLRVPVAVVGTRQDRDSVFAQFTVFVQERATVQERLKALGVPTAVHYPRPLHHQPAYAAHCCPQCCPNSQQAAARVLSLPMSADLTELQLERVVSAVSETTSY
jgi:UDP-2-acetamido-2-deoxy-ribo-hexuluronate aminotransferase